MPKDEHLNTLNLPEDATYEHLMVRYNQVSEILDPDLINNPILAKVALDAQKQIDHAHAYLEKVLPGKPVNPPPETKVPPETKDPPVEVIVTPEEKKTPPEIVEPPKEPPVVPPKPPTLGQLISAELKKRWANLTCADPLPLTQDWWDLNKTTVNALLCILIALLAWYSSLSHAAGGAVNALGTQAQNAVNQIQSLFASIKLPGPSNVNDDSLDIQMPTEFNSTSGKPDPRPINLRQARKFLFNYYSLLKQNQPELAYKAWTNDYRLIHNVNDFTTSYSTSAKFLPSDYTQLPDDAVVLSTATPDVAKIAFQNKWFTGAPGESQISMQYTPEGWRIESQSSVSQRSPLTKPADFIRSYLSLILAGNMNDAYQCLDATYRQQHSYDDWSKSINSLSWTKDKIDNANFIDTYSPADSSPDSATVKEGTSYFNQGAPLTFTDTYTLINNNGSWSIFDITPAPTMFNIDPNKITPFTPQNPPYTPPYTPQNPPYVPDSNNIYRPPFPEIKPDTSNHKYPNPFAPPADPNSK